MHGVNRRLQKKIARERIHKLFKFAEKKALEGRIDLASRYVEIARKIGMKYLVRIPSKYKRRFCSNCHHYLLPGRNCTVRTNKSKVVVSCKDCGNLMRFPFIREVKERRRNK